MSRKVKNKNPFSMGELDRLFDARMYNDVEYLKEWSKRAVIWYENEKNRLYKIIEDIDSKKSANNGSDRT